MGNNVDEGNAVVWFYFTRSEMEKDYSRAYLFYRFVDSHDFLLAPLVLYNLRVAV